MPRRTKEITITAEGRDKGKVFLLTEMPAAKAEKWAMRALLAAAQNGAEVQTAISGMAGVAMAGIQAVLGGVAFSAIEPLLDEMMECVRPLPGAGSHNPELAGLTVRRLIDDDTEEIATRIQLRSEVFALHVGFSFADALSTLTGQSGSTSAGSQSTGTSPG